MYGTKNHHCAIDVALDTKDTTLGQTRSLRQVLSKFILRRAPEVLLKWYYVRNGQRHEIKTCWKAILLFRHVCLVFVFMPCDTDSNQKSLKQVFSKKDGIAKRD